MPRYRCYTANEAFEHSEAYQHGETIEADTPEDAAQQVINQEMEGDPEIKVSALRDLVVRVYPVNTESERRPAIVPKVNTRD